MSGETTSDLPRLPASGVDAGRVPGHWLLARMGKRVLRPGGLRATRWLVEQCAVGPDDDVVELAPGLGVTAAWLIAQRPHSYVGVERDAAAAHLAGAAIGDPARLPGGARVLVGDAARVPLEGESESVVVGEAMLSMQPEAAQERIVAEAARLLRAGGRYAIHELAIDDEQGPFAAEVQGHLSRAVHVGVHLHTPAGWAALLERKGFGIEAALTGPMRLLEPGRMLRDEGLLGAARFCARVLRDEAGRARIRRMRATFRRYGPHLSFIALVGRRARKWQLLETRFEQRDGGPWVTGVCESCAARVDVRLAGGHERLHAWCPNGHWIGVRALRSATQASTDAAEKTTDE